MNTIVKVAVVAVLAWIAYRWWQRRRLNQAAMTAGAASASAAADTGGPSLGGGGIVATSADQAAPIAGGDGNLLSEDPYADAGGYSGPSLGGGVKTSMFTGAGSREQLARFAPVMGPRLAPAPLPIPRPGTMRRFSLMQNTRVVR